MRVLIVAEGKHELGQECEDGALVILVRRLVSRRIQVECEKVRSAKVRVHRRPDKEGGPDPTGESIRRRSNDWPQWVRG